MQTDIYNIDKFIKINNLQLIDDPVTLDKGGQPTPNGVLSIDKFGRDSKSRKNRFGYVNLNAKFIHPIAYKNLRRLDRRVVQIVSGDLYVTIDALGNIIETPENEGGKTGLDFLYKNFDKINFKTTDSMLREIRIELMKGLGKEDIFIDKWVLLPPFYRDINYMNEGKVSLGDINQLYTKLIRLSNSIGSNNYSLSFVLYNTQLEIQKTLVEIYDYFMNDVKGKGGIFRRAVIGKTVDYGSRLVISGHTFGGSQPEDEVVNYYQCKYPLDHCVGGFKLLIVHWLKNFFTNEFATKEAYPVINIRGDIEYHPLDNPSSYFNDTYIENMVSRFIHSGNLRFTKIEVPLKGLKNKYLVFRGRYYDPATKKVEESPLSNRPATWTDLLYMASAEMLKDKHVILTRYPITDQFSVVPNKVFVASTFKTTPMFIDGNFYTHYPVVDLDHPKPESLFENTLVVSNTFLSGMGGDYDGDQLSAKPLLSQQANMEADKLIRSKKLHLSIRGDNQRDSTKELIQTLYNFTK